MKKLIPLIVLLITSSILTAQDTIKGVIMPENGKPVRKKKIWVKKSSDETRTEKTTIAFNPNTLTRQQIEQSGANSLYDLLRGNLPGVTVSENNGKTQVTIRGGSSFELNNEPLFIIDGIEYGNSHDADRSVNINDIEQLEVQSEGTMYGIKGSNGVILITTKKKK